MNVMKTNQNKSLSQKIADILTTAPINSHSEDEYDDVTAAKITLPDSNEEDQNIEQELLSKFRKQNIDLLGDVDNRYSGKRISRSWLDDVEESIEVEGL